MNAAVVESFDRPPRYSTFREPVAGDGGVLVRVRAAALNNLVKGQAAGSHYSSASEMPFVPGYDGVGKLPDGRRVYFFGPPAPFGAMAEWSVAVASRTVPLPDYVDDGTAAALGNPGLASWGALLGRAQLQAGESVLVNGATGVAGQQAIQAAKQLGARRVIATGREQETLQKLLALGADETIWLQQSDDALVGSFRRALAEVDVVLDYLWGRSAECILAAAKGRGNPQGERRVRYVQIGSISGNAISLNADLLRSSGVEMMGSGLGSLSAAAIVQALTEMFEAAASTGLKIETESVPLSEVETAWGRTESGRRMVFTM
ncbi:MAG TPA: zinc-binding alcohol dehydrogenase family protein [Acidobacteriaceae bacterium]|jgi:NADPH:quinone reductase-like Zn-dependent oxidoreductase|nr:zinc-binding alcohol dehydrogenase family protein [Acidobacteriaceae bacterium]